MVFCERTQELLRLVRGRSDKASPHGVSDFLAAGSTPNRIVTADELWSSVWGSNKPLNSESLHVYIYRLRAKLAEFGLQIETMVNVGYRLITPRVEQAKN